MKKLLALILAGVLMFGCVACGTSEETNTESGDTVENTTEEVNPAGDTVDAYDMISRIWEQYYSNADEDLQFIISGGNLESEIVDEPATFDTSLSGAKKELLGYYAVSSETLEQVDDVATLIHSEMTETCSVVVLHVSDTDAVTAAILDTASANEWTDGVPEKVMVVTIGSYVVSVAGDAEIIVAFEEEIMEVYPDAEVVSTITVEK